METTKANKTDLRLRVGYAWSRRHTPSTNCFVIIQSATVFTHGQSNRGTSVMIEDNSIVNKVFKDTDTERAFNNNSDPINFEYVEECMSKDNNATKDYKYFKVVFANGYELVCTNFEEFKTILNT